MDAVSSVTADTQSEISAANAPVQSEKKVDASVNHTTDLQTSSKDCMELIPPCCSIDPVNLRHSVFPIGEVYEISATSCRSS